MVLNDTIIMWVFSINVIPVDDVIHMSLIHCDADNDIFIVNQVVVLKQFMTIC